MPNMKKVNIEEVVEEECSHLGTKQKEESKASMLQHSKLFDRTLRKYPGEPMHIEFEKDAVPVYKRHCPIPRLHLKNFKKELEYLVSIGVLSPVRDTEWGLPT